MTSEEAVNPQDTWTFGDWMESRVVILNDNKELRARLADMIVRESQARAEVARLREAARALIDYQTTGAPAFDEWEPKFDALKAALEAR